MNPFTSFLGGDVLTMVIGLVLVLGVLFYGWIDYRRTSRLPPLGTVLIKNRLKQSSRSTRNSSPKR